MFASEEEGGGVGALQDHTAWKHLRKYSKGNLPALSNNAPPLHLDSLIGMILGPESLNEVKGDWEKKHR